MYNENGIIDREETLGEDDTVIDSEVIWKKEVGKSFLILANVVAGGLVFGQLISDEMDWIVFVLGIFTTFALYISAIKLFKRIV